MANIILQSAENSSLLQTLNQSESKTVPSIYNTKEIYAPSATSWFHNISTDSSNYNPGGSLTFQLPKYGFLEQIIFKMTYKWTVTTAPVTAGTRVFIPLGSAYNLIDRIEFLSSSRVISTLYSQDLVALHSDLRSDQLYPIVQTWAKGAVGVAAAAANVGDSIEAEFALPVVFGFNEDINTVQNLAFNEPCQMRVVFASDYKVASEETGGTIGPQPAGSNVISNGNLSLRYKLYNEADTAMLLDANYSEPQLNMLTHRQYRENPVSIQATAAKTFSGKVELKNVDVINDFYIFVRNAVIDGTHLGSNDTINDCQEITKITLTASGQEICVMDNLTNFYSKLTENGYASVSDVAGSMKMDNVFKIQTGLWENSGGGVWSNGWSARELNNLVLTVEGKCDVAQASLIIYVCETTSTILSTSSNTGRVVNSLVN